MSRREFSPKATREALCVAQVAATPEASRRLQQIIDIIDLMRPLGPDGRHGDRHTVLCGCEDRFDFPDHEGWCACCGEHAESIQTHWRENPTHYDLTRR